MDSERLVIGADIGTTSAKAIVFDAAGAIHGRARHGYPLDSPEPGAAVQDATVVAEAAVAAIGEVVAGATVAGVCLSAAMHSLVGLDSEGRPLTPLLTWGDTRAHAQAARLRAEVPQLHGETGTPLHPMSPLAKLIWLRERDPGTFDSVARWAGIEELVLHRLTGRWAIDRSCASGTGLLEVRTRDWHGRALELAGIDAGKLSPLVDPGTVFESPSGGPPVVIGAGDGPLANLGVGAVRPGVAACSIGTSGALRVMVDRPVADPRGRVFCYLLAGDLWVTGGAISNGGSVLRWVGDALAPDLGEGSERELLALAAEIPAGSDGLVMLPYIMSERAPHWTTVPRGAYVGLTAEHRRGHLVRAALEGVCHQLALVLDSMRAAGNDIEAIRATGGFARSELWCQMLADGLDMPIAFPDNHEGSALGAALMGMEALGIIDSVAVAADLVPPGRIVTPDAAAAATYAAMRPLFADLSDSLEPAFRQLGALGLDEA
ncbi:MAG: gluconokinase [Thermoleophilaceae bacterium]